MKRKDLIDSLPKGTLFIEAKHLDLIAEASDGHHDGVWYLISHVFSLEDDSYEPVAHSDYPFRVEVSDNGIAVTGPNVYSDLPGQPAMQTGKSSWSEITDAELEQIRKVVDAIVALGDLDSARKKFSSLLDD